MIDKLKNIYKSFYSRLGSNEEESQTYADESVLRMLILFTDKLMKNKLDEAELKAKQDEFENLFLIGNYQAINSDIESYMDENSPKLLMDSFLDVIADVVNEMKKGRVIDAQRLAELGNSLKADIENMIAVSRMGEAQTNQGSLQALADAANPLSQQEAPANITQQTYNSVPAQQNVVSNTSLNQPALDQSSLQNVVSTPVHNDAQPVMNPNPVAQTEAQNMPVN